MSKDRSGMKRDIRTLDLDGLTADEAIVLIREVSKGLVDPNIDVEYDGGHITMYGWVPKTDEDVLKELAGEESRQRQLRNTLARMIKDDPTYAREIISEL